MRNASIVCAALLLGAVNVSAQQAGETRGSVYLGDFTLSSYAGHGLTLVEGGGGIAVMHFFKPAFSVELSAGAERQHYQQPISYYYPDGRPPYYLSERKTFTTYPVDAVAQYHFLNDSRWIPYIGLGMHYANGPRNSFDIDSQITGGVLFRMTSSFAVRFDARQLLGSNAGNDWDPGFKPFVGVSWKFGRGSSGSGKSH